MEEKIFRDLYCFQCSFQFEKRSIYDTHQLLVHNYKEKAIGQTEIKIEIEERIELKSRSLAENENLDAADSENLNEDNKTFSCSICEKKLFSKHFR